MPKQNNCLSHPEWNYREQNDGPGGLTAGETISSRGSPTESQPAAELSHWQKLKRDSMLFKIND